MDPRLREDDMTGKWMAKLENRLKKLENRMIKLWSRMIKLGKGDEVRGG
jgi:hypothetical protein